MNPTTEQSHILSLATTTPANLLINALAGTGKTSTLEMIANATDANPILYLAFNRRVAEEATKRFADSTTVRTFNSLGHRIWAKANAKALKLNPKKTQDLLRAAISNAPRSAQGPLWASYWEVINGVSLAKSLGYVPEGKFPTARRLITREDFHASLDETPDGLVADLIEATLTSSIKAAYDGSIDYNDQIYMPALFGGTFPRFPLTMVDEYQDLNPTNHAMLDKLCRNRIIGVGDPWQSIYAFRGAVQGGMSNAQEKFAMTPCDLSISFRCPQAVVEAARWRVPKFQWVKEGGHVESLQELDPATVAEDSAFICRNNAPLFKVAMHFLSAGRSVSVAGSDVGPKLVALLRKLGDETMSRASLLSAIEDWRSERLAKSSTTANDLADCMKVFASFGESLGQAVAYAEHLFAQKGAIKLLTGHKAKGLEWPTVYFLDPWLIGEDEQELNLRYVIQTRAMDTLYEIDSKNIKWS